MKPRGRYSETLCSAKGQVPQHDMTLVIAQSPPGRMRKIMTTKHTEVCVPTGCPQPYQTNHMI